jgi:ferrous iron transport protein A
MAGGAKTMADQQVGRRVVLGAPHLDPARVRRLAELGLRAGTEVLVLHRTAGRGRILAVGETRIALDRATLEALPIASSLDDATDEATDEATDDAIEDCDR